MSRKPCQLRCGRHSDGGVCDDCRAQVAAEAVGFQLPKDIALSRLRDASTVLRAAYSAKDFGTVVWLMDKAAQLTDQARAAIEGR